jgi:hypothetical protein
MRRAAVKKLFAALALHSWVFWILGSGDGGRGASLWSLRARAAGGCRGTGVSAARAADTFDCAALMRATCGCARRWCASNRRVGGAAVGAGGAAPGAPARRQRLYTQTRRHRAPRSRYDGRHVANTHAYERLLLRAVRLCGGAAAALRLCARAEPHTVTILRGPGQALGARLRAGAPIGLARYAILPARCVVEASIPRAARRCAARSCASPRAVSVRHYSSDTEIGEE